MTRGRAPRQPEPRRSAPAYSPPGTGAGPAGYMGCRLLPSGCIVEDMQNGYAKVRNQSICPTLP